MGAALSDSFLLSPYYYSVLGREEEITPEQVERLDMNEPVPEYQMKRAKELVGMLGKKLADVPFLAGIYKRWEADMGINFEAFADEDLETYFTDVRDAHFWSAWCVCVVATPILERSTKLWLLFNVAYRKYKRLKPGQQPPRVSQKKKEEEPTGRVSKKAQMRQKEEAAKQVEKPVPDSRKLLMDRDALEDLLWEIFGILTRILSSDTILAKKHIGTLVERSEFQIFPIKLEQAVTIIKEDQTYNAICRLFHTLLKPQLKELKLHNYRLPAAYIGPLDFALQADWTNAEEIANLIPKTMFMKKKFKKKDLTGIKLSVCEICFLNVMQRVINQYVAQVYNLALAPPPLLVPRSETKQTMRQKRKKYVRAKLAFLIRRCIANLRSLCEMVRFQLPTNYKEYMENISQMLTKSGTPLQAWIVRIFQAIFRLPKKSMKMEPRLTLKDVVLGVVGRDCDNQLADQLVYLAEHSIVESNQVLNVVPLQHRKMLSYGSIDSIPLDDRQKHSVLCIGDLILHQLVDETFCRQLMDETGLTEYDAISKEKYLQSFVPPDFFDLCSDEFDRVVAHRYMADREEGLKEQKGVLVPKPNTTVQTLSYLRQTEFKMSKHMAEGQRRKEKLLKLKEKVEGDLAKEVALEQGLVETMEHTSMHCLSLMEKIRLEDDYDKQEILLNKHVLARYYEERAKRKSNQRVQKLPALGGASARSPSPGSPAMSHGSPMDEDAPRSPLLTARGTYRKERRGLSPEALLNANDLSMRRKKRKKKKLKSMFDAPVSALPATGQKAIILRQHVADRLGMAYRPPEDLRSRVDHLKNLSTLEHLQEGVIEGRSYENSLLFSKYALKVSGKDKIHYEPRRGKNHKDLKHLIGELKELVGEDEDIFGFKKFRQGRRQGGRGNSPTSGAHDSGDAHDVGDGAQDAPQAKAPRHQFLSRRSQSFHQKRGEPRSARELSGALFHAFGLEEIRTQQ
ncbi:unnamed protein product [Amoebophrya sp. A25]|nr:unnamed protein product [Amoebophrya sp. A25]|eukprot:GSA25T00023628001.1